MIFLRLFFRWWWWGHLHLHLHLHRHRHRQENGINQCCNTREPVGEKSTESSIKFPSSCRRQLLRPRFLFKLQKNLGDGNLILFKVGCWETRDTRRRVLIRFFQFQQWKGASRDVVDFSRAEPKGFVFADSGTLRFRPDRKVVKRYPLHPPPERAAAATSTLGHPSFLCPGIKYSRYHHRLCETHQTFQTKTPRMNTCHCDLYRSVIPPGNYSRTIRLV